jgi:hypothetical protein
MQIRKVPVALGDVEAVADEKLVRDREADVADGQVLDQAAVRPVEEGHDGKGRGLAEPQRLAEVVEGEPRVDDVLDDQHVPMRDFGVEILEQPDPSVTARVRVGAVARELDEVEPVRDPDRAGEVGEEDDARLQRRDEQRLAAVVVPRDLVSELPDACSQLPAREVDLPDRRRSSYDASSRRYRCARRSTSRL